MIQNKTSNRTKETIKKTFFDILAEKEFDAIRLSEIIKKSSYSRSTFYKYYDNKFDFVEKVFNEEINSFASAIKNAVSKNSPADNEETSYRMVYEIYEYVDTRKQFFSAIVDGTIPGYSITKASGELYKDLVENIKINDEKWRKGIDKDYYFYMVANDLIATIQYWYRHDYIKTVDDLVEIIINIYKTNGFYSVKIG